MAVPKRKMSKARRDKRRANWKLTVPGLIACPNVMNLKCHIVYVLNVVTTMVKK